MNDGKLRAGKFVWFDHLSRDPDRAKGFYGELFGWGVQRFPLGGDVTYDMITVGGDMIGGYGRLEREGAPARWLAAVSVGDVDGAARAAAAHGGRIVQAPMAIPKVGRIARIADPQGAELHLFKSDSGDPPDARATHGRWVWNELHTTDPGKALAFYAAVVGFTSQPMEVAGGGTYHVLSSPDAVGRGGVSGHLAPGAAPHWLPYVLVDDADAAAHRARMLGAAIEMPPADIPTVGRIAVLRDPTGAALAMLKPAPGM